MNGCLNVTSECMAAPLCTLVCGQTWYLAGQTGLELEQVSMLVLLWIEWVKRRKINHQIENTLWSLIGIQITYINLTESYS